MSTEPEVESTELDSGAEERSDGCESSTTTAGALLPCEARINGSSTMALGPVGSTVQYMGAKHCRMRHTRPRSHSKRNSSAVEDVTLKAELPILPVAATYDRLLDEEDDEEE